MQTAKLHLLSYHLKGSENVSVDLKFGDQRFTRGIRSGYGIELGDQAEMISVEPNVFEEMSGRYASMKPEDVHIPYRRRGLKGGTADTQ